MIAEGTLMAVKVTPMRVILARCMVINMTHVRDHSWEFDRITRDEKKKNTACSINFENTLDKIFFFFFAFLHDK